jgi:hypothetical protein
LFFGGAFGQLLDLVELVAPEAFKGGGPLVERADGVGVGFVEHVAAVAADAYQANVLENAEVLGDGRLFEAEAIDDFVYGALLKCEVIQDVAATGFGDGVEGIGGCGGARHGFNIFPYRNMSRGKFECFEKNSGRWGSEEGVTKPAHPLGVIRSGNKYHEGVVYLDGAGV